MIRQHTDRPSDQEGDPIVFMQRGERSYYAEVWAGQPDEQSRLVEQVIRFAFDTLAGRHVDVRVRPAD